MAAFKLSSLLLTLFLFSSARSFTLPTWRMSFLLMLAEDLYYIRVLPALLYVNWIAMLLLLRLFDVRL